MRCRACNEQLNEYEIKLKYTTIDEYIDLCKECLKISEIPYLEKQSYEKEE